MIFKSRLTNKALTPILFLLLFGIAGFIYSPSVVLAQSDEVQEVIGEIEPGAALVYRFKELTKGQTVYVYAAGISGNLDPTIVLVEGDADPITLRDQYRGSVSAAISAGEDPVTAVDELAKETFLDWDDDSGHGYDSSLAFTAPADGTYLLAIGSSLLQPSAGEYRLLVGIDAPEVLSGEAQPTTETIVFFQDDLSRLGMAVQEINGSLSAEDPFTFYNLQDFRPGETFYAYVEAKSGDLAPVLILEDFGEKPIRSANYLGEQTTGNLEYTFNAEAKNYRLRVSSCCEGEYLTEGDFHLLVGVNAPDVLTGVAKIEGNPVLKEAREVQIGAKIQQITSVDQKAENFGVVATIQMTWTDPDLAYSPDTCQCNFKLFDGNEFVDFASQNEIPWPEFTIFNQQGRRDTQNQLVLLLPDGQATYIERFSATLQAPDFDFRRFPFDDQQFYLRIDSLFPEEFFIFSDLPGYSEFGEQLGEEEWIISDFETEITTEIASTQRPTSRFSFGFVAERHVSFYVIRVFIPILVIIAVSWITFFLKDYSKRVDVSAGNLLLFIAFNFTISGDLPRLGYLTFLDTVLITTFVVTGLVVALNVVLKRLELAGKEELAYRIDRYTIWLYPLAYVLGLALVTLFFT